MMNNYIRVRILRISSLSLVAVLFLWESLRGVSQSNLRASSLQTLWSWILFQSTSSISCVNNFLYCFHILAAGNTSAIQQKKYKCFFVNTKVIAQQNKNQQQNKWYLWKKQTTRFFNQNFHAWSIWASLCSGGKLMGQVDLCRPFAVVYQSFTSRPHTNSRNNFLL